MGLLLRQYTDGERERHKLRGVVTGKDTRIGGSEGRVKATGQGLAYCIQEWFAERGATPAGSTFILQGFGNVGSNAAEILCGLGSRLLAVNDAGGTVFNPAGIDVNDLVSYVYDNPRNLRRTVGGYPKAQQISKTDLWDVDADICIPAALGGEITGPVAERLKVKLVAEGANGPTTPEGDRVLAKRGIELIPDIIGNAGGVTVSYYEWIQNKRMEHWSETEVNGRLEQAIKSNYRIIRDISRNTPRRTATHNSQRYCIGREVDMRTSAAGPDRSCVSTCTPAARPSAASFSSTVFPASYTRRSSSAMSSTTAGSEKTGGGGNTWKRVTDSPSRRARSKARRAARCAGSDPSTPTRIRTSREPSALRNGGTAPPRAGRVRRACPPRPRPR